MKDISTKLAVLGFLLFFLFILSLPLGRISLANIEVNKTGKNLCRYTMQRINNGFKNGPLNVNVSLISGDGKSQNFSWTDDTLKTENPRLDYLLSPKCPDYVEKGGIKSISYTVSEISGEIVLKGNVGVSTAFTDRTK